MIYSALYVSHDPFDLNMPIKAIVEPKELKKGGILLLHGGADISPAIYKRPLSKYSHAQDTLSQRDELEVELTQEAIKLGMPIIGICRGAQLLCAMSGGTLYQHLFNHGGGRHILVDRESGKHFYGNSAHHQAMCPTTEAEILATVEEQCYAIDKDDEKPVSLPHVNEVVFFPNIRAIGIQGHPEWMPNKSEFNKYCAEKIKEKLL
jgi:putative glutamine amidotransferase